MTPVSELADFLPHRGAMVWIDYVTAARADGGECLVKIDPKKHYFSDAGLRQTAYIEWMAQGFGFVNALYYKQNQVQKSIEKAFMVAVEKMSFAENMPVAGDEVMISVNHVRTVGPISYVEGKVYSVTSNVTYCDAVIKLFSA